MAKSKTVAAVLVAGTMYRIGRRAHKPADTVGGGGGKGVEAIVAGIVCSGGKLEIAFADGERFVFVNTPTVLIYDSQEKAAGIVPADSVTSA